MAQEMDYLIEMDEDIKAMESQRVEPKPDNEPDKPTSYEPSYGHPSCRVRGSVSQCGYCYSRSTMETLESSDDSDDDSDKDEGGGDQPKGEDKADIGGKDEEKEFSTDNVESNSSGDFYSENEGKPRTTKSMTAPTNRIRSTRVAKRPG